MCLEVGWLLTGVGEEADVPQLPVGLERAEAHRGLET